MHVITRHRKHRLSMLIGGHWCDSRRFLTVVHLLFSSSSIIRFSISIPVLSHLLMPAFRRIWEQDADVLPAGITYTKRKRHHGVLPAGGGKGSPRLSSLEFVPQDGDTAPFVDAVCCTPPPLKLCREAPSPFKKYPRRWSPFAGGDLHASRRSPFLSLQKPSPAGENPSRWGAFVGGSRAPYLALPLRKSSSSFPLHASFASW